MSNADSSPSRALQHRDLLRDLTAPGADITAESEHASQRNSAWFDQDTGQPLAPRGAVHRDILREFRAESPHVQEEYKAILLAGPPGAGKTTAQSQLLASTGTAATDWRILNADDFKDRLLKRAITDGSYASHLTPAEVAKKEQAGEKVWPRERAALVHEESSLLMKAARDQAIRKGENVFIDGTLSNADSGKKLVKRLEEQGYEVRIALVDGPRDVTEARVAHRWTQGFEAAESGVDDPDDPDLLLLGGRWVPADVTDGLYRDGTDASVCTAAAYEIAESSDAVKQLDAYQVTKPSGQPEVVERRIGKREDGRWEKVWRVGAARDRHKSKRAEILDEASSSGGGSAPRCSVCGRPLRSAESIARGAGPTCAGAHVPAPS